MNSKHYKRLIRRGAGVLIALCAVVNIAASARAADVQLSLSSYETFIGMPIVAQITINNGQNFKPPEFPAIDGVDIKSAGEPSRSAQIMNFNGRVSRNESVSYSFLLNPRREDKFTVPPIKIEVDGQTFTTEAAEFVATKSETGDLMFVEVIGQKKEAFVGEPIKLTLTIWIKPYRDNKYNFRLSANNMWELMLGGRSEWGIFREEVEDLIRQRRMPSVHEVLRADGEGKDRSYYMYEIEHVVYPQNAGQLDVGDIQIVAKYPTGLERDFFDRFSLDGVRLLATDAKIEPINVKPVPTEGMPADYRGAIGRFDIATQAMPTKVKVGDQISMRIQVTGGERLDSLQAPPLAKLPQLTRDFKVTEEPLAGVVNGRVKTFVATLRPLRTDVKEIPAIPFSSFDPETGEFVTAKSDPIPIEVSPADELALSNIISASGSRGRAKSVDEPAEAVNPLTWQFRGSSVLNPSQPPSDGVLLAALATPPLMFFGLLALRQSRGWLRDSSLWRRRQAQRLATRRLNRADSSEDVARAAFGYVADHFCLNAASLTRRELVGELQNRGVSGEVVCQWDELLAECENSKFSGGMTSSPQELARRARGCIAGVDRLCTTRGDASCSV